MEIFYLKVNQPPQITGKYLTGWLEIIRQFPNYKIYIVCDKPDLQTFITEGLRNGGVIT
ncbi:MAG: hypothetical protein IJT06_04405 [Selenomonadaceae bacterium]|nr:hypothetical protein [Selenomonadaceae bacterium]